MSKSRTAIVLVAIAVVSTVLALVWQSVRYRSPAVRPARLVVLYATCTLNRDYLGPYNSAIRFTPHLEKFAAAGTTFRRHVAESGQSGPSFASLFTGWSATRHGVLANPSDLDDDATTVFEAFSEAGYDVHFWFGHKMASPSLNFAQGVPPANVRRRVFGREPLASHGGADRDFAQILMRLRGDPEYKALVVINFTMTHSPYNIYVSPERLRAFCDLYSEACSDVDLSESELSKWITIYSENLHQLERNYPGFVRSLRLSSTDLAKLDAVIELHYKAAIQQLDEVFGTVLKGIDMLGLTADSLVAFTADHGEVTIRDNAMFRWTHGFQLAPEVLDVPLIIGGRARHTSQVKHYTEVTRSIDVVPTLLGMAGAEPRRDFAFDGVDLSEAVLDGQQQPQLVALSHGSIVHPRVAERSSSWTLFHRYYSDTSPENVWVRVRQRDLVVKLMRDESLDWVVRAFDLSKDPSETSDIFSSADEEHTHLRSQALAYKQEIIRAYLTRREANQRRNRDPEADLERLRALGYIK